MKIDFTWRHGDKSAAIEELLCMKLEKLERHADDVAHVQVTFEYNKQDYTVKIMAHAYGKDIQAHATHFDVYTAMDEVAHKLIRQVEEYKERQKAH